MTDPPVETVQILPKRLLVHQIFKLLTVKNHAGVVYAPKMNQSCFRFQLSNDLNKRTEIFR